jgi:hypothetical protein
MRDRKADAVGLPDIEKVERPTPLVLVIEQFRFVHLVVLITGRYPRCSLALLAGGKCHSHYILLQQID